MPIVCTEILPDGTPGRSVEFGDLEILRIGANGKTYAEAAAHRLNGDVRPFGNTIEVRGLPGGPERFRVVCEVVRNYRAERMEV